MKAMIYRRYGGPEVLELATLDEPRMSQNSVLVRIKAAALNPADIQLQAGLGASHTDAWFPVIPGWDMAGIVEQVGTGVSEFRAGDAVIGYVRQEILHHGTYAEKVATPLETLALKPNGLGWAEAAGLPLAGLTAYRAICQILDVKPGERVLILGASGGVGSMAAQLARLRGGVVTGTGSAANQDYLHTLGITPLTHDSGHTLNAGDYDIILDCAGKGALAALQPATDGTTRRASIADFGAGFSTVFARSDAAILAELAHLAAQGELRVRVAETYPLERAADAQRALARPRGAGKIILTTT